MYESLRAGPAQSSQTAAPVPNSAAGGKLPGGTVHARPGRRHQNPELGKLTNRSRSPNGRPKTNLPDRGQPDVVLDRNCPDGGPPSTTSACNAWPPRPAVQQDRPLSSLVRRLAGFEQRHRSFDLLADHGPTPVFGPAMEQDRRSRNPQLPQTLKTAPFPPSMQARLPWMAEHLQNDLASVPGGGEGFAPIRHETQHLSAQDFLHRQARRRRTHADHIGQCSHIIRTAEGDSGRVGSTQLTNPVRRLHRNRMRAS